MQLPSSQSEAMQVEVDDFLTSTTKSLLDQLDSDTKGNWGKMSAQHMVEHVSSLFYISWHDLGLPSAVPEDKIEKAQSFLWRDDKMFRKGTRAPILGDTPPDLRFENLEKAKEVLQENIDAFYAFYTQEEGEEPKTLMHPAFGMLDFKGWKRFHHKHIVHHFAQFGLMEADMSPDPKPNA